MNKLEANVSLLVITFFAAVQYVFLAWVPDSVSHFAFMSVTNLAGFLMTLAFFFSELFRLDGKQVLQSMVLSLELMVFNVFLLLGVSGVGPVITGAVLSTYFVFIVILSVFIFHQRPSRANLWGCAVVLLGLFFMMDADAMGLWNRNILYLLIADAAFALYIITVGSYAASSNPSIIAMGQMFFCFLFSLAFWAGEAFFYGGSFSLPVDPAFWGGVIYISIFIRGLYGVVQVYAQRYASPLNTSLVFSTEIIMTMAASPMMSRLFGIEGEQVTPLRLLGSVAIAAGLLIVDPTLWDIIRNRAWFSPSRAPRGRTAQRFYPLYMALCAALPGGCGLLIGGAPMALVFGAMGAMAGIPIAILLEGVLHVGFSSHTDDLPLRVTAGAESLGGANDAMERAAAEREIGMKRVFEAQSCLEELSIRIFNARPDAAILVRLQFGDAISMRMSWSGEKYNPLYITANEDEAGVAGLKIIRHRALQAAFSYRNGENRMHIVI